MAHSQDVEYGHRKCRRRRYGQSKYTHCHNTMAVVLVWLLWLHSLRLYHVTSIPKGAPPRLRGPLAGQDATLPQLEPEP